MIGELLSKVGDKHVLTYWEWKRGAGRKKRPLTGSNRIDSGSIFGPKMFVLLSTLFDHQFGLYCLRPFKWGEMSILKRVAV